MNHVVVPAAEHTSGFGTVRALAGSGAHVTGFVMYPKSHYCASRWFSEIITVPTLGHYVEMLADYGHSLNERAVLFPGNDLTVAIVSENRDALKPYYDFCLPDRHTVSLMTDKERFGEWLVANGYDHPRTAICRSRDELEEQLEKCKFPVIIKPHFRSDRWNHVSPMKAFKFESLDEIKALNFDFLSATPVVLLQEWIPGTDADIHYCLAYYGDYGRETAYYTGHKLLQYPSGSGSGALVVGAINDEVHSLTKEIFDKLNFRGIGSMEFKRHTGNGRYYVIEPTVGRNDVFSYICVAGKMNLTMMAYNDMIRKPYRVPARSKRAFWLDEETAFQLAKREGAMKLAKQLLSVVGCRPSFAFLNLRDPAPLVAKFANRIRSFLQLKARPVPGALE